MSDEGGVRGRERVKTMAMESAVSSGRSVARVLVLVVVMLAGGWQGAHALDLGGAAPEIAGGPWINSPPLTMAGLRGRVVLVEFWTYG